MIQKETLLCSLQREIWNLWSIKSLIWAIPPRWYGLASTCGASWGRMFFWLQRVCEQELQCLGVTGRAGAVGEELHWWGCRGWVCLGDAALKQVEARVQERLSRLWMSFSTCSGNRVSNTTLTSPVGCHLLSGDAGHLCLWLLELH